MGFVSPSRANRRYYVAILERLLPPGSGIPGPVVTRENIIEAVNAVKPGYRDAFRRFRELQGEEGLTGIIKSGASFQLVSLAVSEKRTPRKALGLRLAQEIVLRQGSRCAVCGTPIAAEGSNRAEIDHKVLRIRNGTNDEDNLQALCTLCNNTKSTQCPNCTAECQTCAWAFPEICRPVKLRSDIIQRLNKAARDANQDVNDLANSILSDRLPRTF